MIKIFLLLLLTLSFEFSQEINDQSTNTLNDLNGGKIIHFSGHYLLPVAIAYASYGSSWKNAAKVMLSSNLVDADHILAKPIYDPDRCSIRNHPLHSIPAIGIYSVMSFNESTEKLGIGLLTHMAVDFVDCINTRDRLGTLKFPKLYRDPVNKSSLGHIIFGYGISQIEEIKPQHMLLFSISWEILEVSLPMRFSQESYLNKFFDILFSSLGFYIGKQVLVD